MKKFENNYSNGHAWFAATIHVFPLYIAIFKKYAINKQEYLINYSVEQLLLEFTEKLKRNQLDSSMVLNFLKILTLYYIVILYHIVKR